MKFIVQVVLIAAASYVAEMFFPWWTVVLCAFLVNLFIPTKGLNAFLSGFLGVGLLWLIAAWLIDQDTNSILTARVAELLYLGEPFLLVVVTGVLGGILGGFGALTGSLLRNLRRSADVTKQGYYR